MDLDQGGRPLAGLVLDAAGRGHHDQVADLIAALDWHVASTVFLTTDTGQPDRDRYGRMLRYVDHAGTDAARELLAAGNSTGLRHRPALARETDYAAAAQDAPQRRGQACGATADHQVIAPTPGPDLGDQEDWRSRCRSVGSTGSHHERLRRSRGSST